MFITVDGKKIHYHQKGRGEAFLFVHGWGGSINSLMPIFNLACRDFKVIILSLPGFGQSDSPDPDWGVKEYANFLAQFLTKLGLNKINYFGHSFGGSLGIYLASYKPELFHDLILCASSYKRTGKTSTVVSQTKKILPGFILSNKIGLFLKKIIYRIFFPDSDLLKYPHLESNFRKIVNDDLSQYLPKIEAKTLILWGNKDQITPVSLAYELKQKIKNAKLKIFSDSTHSLPLKQPEAVYQEVKKFVIT